MVKKKKKEKKGNSGDANSCFGPRTNTMWGSVALYLFGGQPSPAAVRHATLSPSSASLPHHPPDAPHHAVVLPPRRQFRRSLTSVPGSNSGRAQGSHPYHSILSLIL